MSFRSGDALHTGFIEHMELGHARVLGRFVGESARGSGSSESVSDVAGYGHFGEVFSA